MKCERKAYLSSLSRRFRATDDVDDVAPRGYTAVNKVLTTSPLCELICQRRSSIAPSMRAGKTCDDFPTENTE